MFNLVKLNLKVLFFMGYVYFNKLFIFFLILIRLAINSFKRTNNLNLFAFLKISDFYNFESNYIDNFITSEFDYKKSCQESLKEIELFSNERLDLKLINNSFVKHYVQLKFDNNNLRFKIGDLFYKNYLMDKLCFLEVEFEKLYNFYSLYNLDTELNMLKLKTSNNKIILK